MLVIMDEEWLINDDWSMVIDLWLLWLMITDEQGWQLVTMMSVMI